MKKMEAPANMDNKVKELSRRIGKLCADAYDAMAPEQREEVFQMLDDLDKAMIAYKGYEIPWDSVLIDVVEKIGDRKVKTKAFSTTESVMDKARELFVKLAN